MKKFFIEENNSPKAQGILHNFLPERLSFAGH